MSSPDDAEYAAYEKVARVPRSAILPRPSLTTVRCVVRTSSRLSKLTFGCSSREPVTVIASEADPAMVGSHAPSSSAGTGGPWHAVSSMVAPRIAAAHRARRANPTNLALASAAGNVDLGFMTDREVDGGSNEALLGSVVVQAAGGLDHVGGCDGHHRAKRGRRES